MEPTDAELWEAVRGGETAAFGRIFDRHARTIYNYAFRRTADWSAAEDVMAVVFLETWRHRERLRLVDDSCLPWLYGVAANVLRNHHRRRRRHAAALDRLPPMGDEPGFEADLTSRLDDQHRARDLVAAVAQLPAGQRDVITLCVWESLSYEEASVALGIPVGTVRSRLSRAKANLRGDFTRDLTGELTGEPGPTSGHERGEGPERPPTAREEAT